MSHPLYRSLFSADRAPAAMRVLRSHEAALVLCFLQENFKAGNYTPCCPPCSNSCGYLRQILTFTRKEAVADNPMLLDFGKWSAALLLPVRHSERAALRFRRRAGLST